MQGRYMPLAAEIPLKKQRRSEYKDWCINRVQRAWDANLRRIRGCTIFTPFFSLSLLHFISPLPPLVFLTMYKCLLALGLLASSLLVKADLSVNVQINGEDIVEDDMSELRLIQLSEQYPAQWMTGSDIRRLHRENVRFMDITDSNAWRVANRRESKYDLASVTPAYQEEVNRFIKDIRTDGMKAHLTRFTKFHNRYYKSSWGGKSSRWLISRVRDIAAENEAISVKEFKHNWDQFSIIARFEGTNETLSNEAVIISAHQDSLNMWLPSFGRAPGADDDGSGTVTILEAFRSLVQNGFTPERPVEFHWYSAEEGGLLGSQAVAEQYAQDDRDVLAMMQIDMTGYIGARGEVIGVTTDYVDDKLTEFIKKLVNTYASISYVETQCGYACSDHASWRKFGYPSAFVMESAFEDSNQYIHTSGDTIDKLSFEHMAEFAKLAAAFVVELSHI